MRGSFLGWSEGNRKAHQELGSPGDLSLTANGPAGLSDCGEHRREEKPVSPEPEDESQDERRHEEDVKHHPHGEQAREEGEQEE